MCNFYVFISQLKLSFVCLFVFSFFNHTKHFSYSFWPKDITLSLVKICTTHICSTQANRYPSHNPKRTQTPLHTLAYPYIQRLICLRGLFYWKSNIILFLFTPIISCSHLCSCIHCTLLFYSLQRKIL